MKKLISAFMVFSLLFVFGMVLFLEAIPQFCSESIIAECEVGQGGSYSYYYDYTVWYNGTWVDVYDTWCDDNWWGICYDIDEIF
jgi:hypothetical protein